MRIVQKAVCFACGDWVLARATLSADGSGVAETLTCPTCGSTWTPRRLTGGPDGHGAGDGFTGSIFAGERCAVVAVGGEIDISTAVRFRDLAWQALGDEPKGIVVDLTDVTFMDSTGVAVLVLMRRQTTTRGIPLVVVSNGSIDTLLRVSGMDTILDIHPTLAAAVAAM